MRQYKLRLKLQEGALTSRLHPSYICPMRTVNIHVSGKPAQLTKAYRRCLVNVSQHQSRTTTSDRFERPIPEIGQQHPTDCGRAALQIVAQWYGLALGPLEVGCPPERMSLWRMCQLARQIGLEPMAGKIKRTDLGYVNMPCITLSLSALSTPRRVRYHFVVLFSADSDGVVLSDPNCGAHKMETDRFDRRWTGLVVLFNRRLERAHE
jgi:Peptidase C39 family